jgi:hypothetical protein
MRETAERALQTHCGSRLKFSVLGNAPLSFYKYKYPRRYRETSQRQGAKVFIYKAYLSSSYDEPVVVEPGEGVLDYSWATLQARMFASFLRGEKIIVAIRSNINKSDLIRSEFFF